MLKEEGLKLFVEQDEADSSFVFFGNSISSRFRQKHASGKHRRWCSESALKWNASKGNKSPEVKHIRIIMPISHENDKKWYDSSGESTIFSQASQSTVRVEHKQNDITPLYNQ